jgi:hypothetical protein
MGNLLSTKNSNKSLHALRIEITTQLQKYKQEYVNRNDQSMVDFFDNIDLEFNKKYIEKSKSNSNIATTQSSNSSS